jgi:hypothetical protein
LAAKSRQNGRSRDGRRGGVGLQSGVTVAKGCNGCKEVLQAVGTVMEPIVTLLIGGIRSMQNIHSRNQRQAAEASVMATRRWRLHAFWWISLGLAFNCFIGITYTS